LAIAEDVEFAISDDGSSGAVEVVSPELVFSADLPGLGELGLVRGSVLIRAAPIEPASDISGGKRGGGEKTEG
jgi:hypothetical protein